MENSATTNSNDVSRDLLEFIDDSPSPYHAVASCTMRLKRAGFRPLDESQSWSLRVGDKAYVVRDDGSLVAFILGTDHPQDSGFRVLGAHTDSPNFRIKPSPELTQNGYQQLSAEPYGGVLYSTWMDRDLSVAGRFF